MIVAVWINCPTKEVAERIAAGLMDQRLIACANCYPPISSRYFWKGRIEETEEIPLLVKTTMDLFDRVAETARQLHPYETPSIIAQNIARANQDYIDWIHAETMDS